MGRRDKELITNITIESIAAEGNAVAHVDGKALFVPFCVPGDVVDVQITHKRTHYMMGYVMRLVTPSPHRLPPFCSHFGDCGGCKWQPLPYPMQLIYKQQQVVDQLTRIGRLTLPEVSPILGSEHTTGYRNKLEFTFSNAKWRTFEEMRALGELEGGPDTAAAVGAPDCTAALGFHITGRFDKVLDIERCYLQEEPSNAIRLEVKRYALEQGLPFFDLRSQTGFLRNLMIRITTTGQIMVLLAFAHDNPEAGEDHAARLALLKHLMNRFPQITSLQYVINTKKNDNFSDLPVICYAGLPYITENMEGLLFRIGPKSFYQTNSHQAYRLYQVVRSFAGLGPGTDAGSDFGTDAGSDFGIGPDSTPSASPSPDTASPSPKKPLIYDLYTGTGTIALFLARYARQVVGIEYVPEAIEDAHVNAQANGIHNVKFFAGDMKDLLTPDFVTRQGVPDIIVLDPPRAGVHDNVLKVILDTAPARIVYVSCNPATQARDLQILCAHPSVHYAITAVQPVDMFPHTQHVENVVLLERQPS